MLPFSHSIYWKDFKLLWTQWTETATAKYFQIVCCSPWWRILLSCGWWWNIWWNIWSDYMLNNMLCFSSGLCALSGDPALCLLKLAWPLNIINVNLGLCCTCICNEELCAQTHLNALQKTREMGTQLINKHTHGHTNLFLSEEPNRYQTHHTDSICMALMSDRRSPESLLSLCNAWTRTRTHVCKLWNLTKCCAHKCTYSWNLGWWINRFAFIPNSQYKADCPEVKQTVSEAMKVFRFNSSNTF